ncbi:hypothetical protein F6S84_00715 [Bifidobacterium dentium]|nr:hypothetical protein [Bifidobacterium dentium]NEG53435.1 hypothetical protein [Bifidobacterium dentium]
MRSQSPSNSSRIPAIRSATASPSHLKHPKCPILENRTIRQVHPVPRCPILENRTLQGCRMNRRRDSRRNCESWAWCLILRT